MSDLTLVIGSKTCSSWSLRPWLLLRYHNVSFREECIALDQPDTQQKIAAHSPSGRVPVLKSGNVVVWESLAICEYLAETLKLPGAWPSDPAQKAKARALSCEMLSGFADLRRELPMDSRRAPAPHQFGTDVAKDVARIRSIWRQCREDQQHKGDWLFGAFGIVDAMYAPVALRLHSYAVPLEGPEKDYKDAMLNLPALREWLGAAMLEPVSGAAAPTKTATAAEPPPKPEAKPSPKPEPRPAAKSESGSKSRSDDNPAPVVKKSGRTAGKMSSYIIPD